MNNKILIILFFILLTILLATCSILNNPFMKTNLNKYLYGQYPMIYSYNANPSLVKTRHNTTLSVRAANHENVDLSYTYEIITGTGTLSGEGKDIHYHTEDVFTDISVKTTVYSIFGWTDTAVATASVKDYQKINDLSGDFTATLDDGDQFGGRVASIGDFDNDSIIDVAIAATNDNDGGSSRGAIYLLFLNSDATVKSYQKISDTQGNFTGTLDGADGFGGAIISLGDFDNDGITDIATGSRYDDDGGTDRGAVWILLLNTDGTVKSYQKISDTEGGFTGTLNNTDCFSSGLASLGDLDNDGVTDLAVGACFDDDGGSDRGAVWILFLNSDGTVKNYQKISDTQGNFTGTLDNGDYFGHWVSCIGDLNNDGVNDLAVGAYLDDDGGSGRGAVWILFLNSDGTVNTYQKISDTQGNFTGTLGNDDQFGVSVDAIGDLNNDGVMDLVVGTNFDDDGGSNRGAVWILFLNTDGTVKTYQKISSTQGGFTGVLSNSDSFAESSAGLGDFNKDGVPDIIIGAWYDDDGGSNRGAAWILLLNSDGTVTNY